MFGIYQITNIKTGKYYIGSAVNFKGRWSLHISQLDNGTHCNAYLLNSWKKHGKEAFEFSVLEVLEDRSKLVEREQYWMDEKKAYEKEYGYNICRIAGSSLGLKISPESIKKRLTPEYISYLKNRFRGSKNNMAKLDEDQVSEIKIMLMGGDSHGVVAKKFNVSRSNIGLIAVGKTWSHVKVDGWEPVTKDTKKLTEEDVVEIKKSLMDGKTLESLAEQYGVGNSIIGSIKLGKKWGKVNVEGFNTERTRMKISEDTVRGIRDMLAEGVKQKYIASYYGVSNQSVSAIKTGNMYKDIR